MDLVYICRDGDNEELRYSIRSAVANLPHDKVWVVGGKPDWYSGNYIPVPQTKTKYMNAKTNMLVISETKEISNNFILMNDDFFILKPQKSIRYYHGGSLLNKIKHLQKRYGSGAYIKLLLATKHFLKTRGIFDTLDYALHVPFKMNRNKLKEILQFDVSWRIAYGNLYSVGGTEVKINSGDSKDVKVYKYDGQLHGIVKNTISDIFLSSNDDSFDVLLPKLQELFPEPSSYEK
jgi:hypothetical protein